MKLVYTTKRTGFISGVTYRNPDYFESIEKTAESVTIDGDYPHIEDAYKAAGIEVTKPADTSHQEPPREGTTAYFKLKLTEAGVEFNPSANKAELQALFDGLNQAT